jgi:uncharacterized damage-inducible protein DinB
MKRRYSMAENILVRLFEHNNWANQHIIQACSELTEEQLDTPPQSVTKGTIRETLTHLVGAQHNYLSLLTLPPEERIRITPEFTELLEVARLSGDGLLALARDPNSDALREPLRTRDNYLVEPWVIMLQAINHATEHREQINSMLSALGFTPPDLDGWSFGEATSALVPGPK